MPEQNGGQSSNPGRESRILEAAARLIVHFGYDKTTVSDIAREAGISKGAVYLHFASKEALFEALLWHQITQFTDDFLGRMEANPDAWSFVGMFRIMLLTMEANPFMLALLKRDQHILGSYLRGESGLLNMKFIANSEVFGALQAAGAVRDDIPPAIIAHIINMLAYGLVSVEDITRTQTIPTFEALTDGVAKMLDRALMPEDGGNPEAAKALIMEIIRRVREQFPAS